MLQPQRSYPRHDHATDHVLLRELRRPRRKLTSVAEPSGEVAARRIRELAWDLGADLDHWRWMAEVARRMDVPYKTLYECINGAHPTVSSQTVDRVARKLQIPIAAFYDSRF